MHYLSQWFGPPVQELQESATIEEDRALSSALRYSKLRGMTLAAFLRAGVCRFHARHPRRQVRMGGYPQAHAHSKYTAWKAADMAQSTSTLDLIGTVQFTANDGMEDQQREEEKALDLLASHSPQAARHPVLGFVTWEAELANIEDVI